VHIPLPPGAGLTVSKTEHQVRDVPEVEELPIFSRNPELQLLSLLKTIGIQTVSYGKKRLSQVAAQLPSPMLLGNPPQL
jgi:hypothetical protein